MKNLSLAVIAAFALSVVGHVFAQSDAPYTEGPVWAITMVKTKAGMSDDYLKMLAKIFKAENEELKKAGAALPPAEVDNVTLARPRVIHEIPVATTKDPQP